MTYFLISIYFCINSFILGTTYKEYTIIGKLIILVFGLPIYSLVFIEGFWYWQNKYTHINFWFHYFFTKKIDNYSIEKLESVNKIFIRNHYERFLVKLINKRNNFIG